MDTRLIVFLSQYTNKTVNKFGLSHYVEDTPREVRIYKNPVLWYEPALFDYGEALVASIRQLLGDDTRRVKTLGDFVAVWFLETGVFAQWTGGHASHNAHLSAQRAIAQTPIYEIPHNMKVEARVWWVNRLIARNRKVAPIEIETALGLLFDTQMVQAHWNGTITRDEAPIAEYKVFTHNEAIGMLAADIFDVVINEMKFEAQWQRDEYIDRAIDNPDWSKIRAVEYRVTAADCRYHPDLRRVEGDSFFIRSL